LAVAALIFAGLCTAVLGQETDSGDEVPQGRHRLDLSMSNVDAAEGDTYVLLPGYTFTLRGGLRAGITTQYVYVESEGDSNGNRASVESGLGDTYLSMQYDPSANITASPWIPDTIGLTFGLLAPTGDADEGLSGDRWEWNVGAGWAFSPFGQFYLVPAITYGKSFDEGRDVLEAEFAGIDLGLLWLLDNGFWFGYTPYLERNLADHEWRDDHYLVLGKMWRNGIGASLEYGSRDRIDPAARRDDYTTFLNLYYQFGRAPR
jgi:hypothetical protein